jgi:ubiquinone/menaquinone biosynthesis C-methylase UbiE
MERRITMLRTATVVIAALVIVTPAWAQPPDAKQLAQERAQAELDVPKLVDVLRLRPGMTVADVGAGFGAMTVVLGKWIGDGHVFATDIGQRQLQVIREYVEKEGLKNVTVLEGAAAATNLPPACCDAIFMRDVYHHITEPEAFNKSLLASIKPGGRVAIIDFPPQPGSKLPAGVPANRGGHGIPPAVVVQELTAAGFAHLLTIDKWPSEDERSRFHLTLFTKPVAQRAAAPEPNALGQPLLDAAGHPREDAFYATPLAPQVRRPRRARSAGQDQAGHRRVGAGHRPSTDCACLRADHRRNRQVYVD